MLNMSFITHLTQIQKVSGSIPIKGQLSLVIIFIYLLQQNAMVVSSYIDLHCDALYYFI